MKTHLPISVYKTGLIRFLLLGCLLVGCTFEVHSQSISGTTGLFHIPTAEMMPDKTVMIGYTHLPKEVTTYRPGQYDNRLGYATVTFLPRLEVMFRYTYDLGAPRGPDISLFMDRMVAARVLLLKQRRYLPAVVFGMHDPGLSVDLAANSYFGANYLVASKMLQPFGFILGLHSGLAFDLLGEETQTMKGLFGGLSVSHSAIPWATAMVEHDSNRLNAAVKLLFMGHLQVMAGLMDMQYPAGGIGMQIQL